MLCMHPMPMRHIIHYISLFITISQVSRQLASQLSNLQPLNVSDTDESSEYLGCKRGLLQQVVLATGFQRLSGMFTDRTCFLNLNNYVPEIEPCLCIYNVSIIFRDYVLHRILNPSQFCSSLKLKKKKSTFNSVQNLFSSIQL